MSTSVSGIKRVAWLRAWLDGRGYFSALTALEFAIEHHQGTRNDGSTPIVLHPIDVCLFLVPLTGLLVDPAGTLRDALLHDTVEDCPGISVSTIETEFGAESAQSVDLLSAPPGETSSQKAERFSRIARDPRSAPVKLADRDHNLSTMLGVFHRARVEKYVRETHDYFLPLAREARRAVPAQGQLYIHLRTGLKHQLRPIEMILATPGALQ